MTLPASGREIGEASQKASTPTASRLRVADRRRHSAHRGGRGSRRPCLHNHPSVPIPRSSNPARYGVRGGGAGGNADAVGDYDIRSDLVAPFGLGEAAGAAGVLVGESGWLMSDRGPMARTVPKWCVSRRDRAGSRSQQPSGPHGRLSRATCGGGCRDGDRIDGVRVCALALRVGSAERPRPWASPVPGEASLRREATVGRRCPDGLERGTLHGDNHAASTPRARVGRPRSATGDARCGAPVTGLAAWTTRLPHLIG